MGTKLRHTAVNRSASMQRTLSRVLAGSTVHRFGRWLSKASRNAFLSRRLTREPDPQVVFIDFRDTWTVGPIVALGERLSSTGTARRLASGTGSIAAAFARSFRRAPVRTSSFSLLGFCVVATVLTWSSGGTAVRLGWLAILALSALGLRVDATWNELAESRPGRAIRRLFEPPAREDYSDD